MRHLDCMHCRECDAAPKMAVVESRPIEIGGVVTIWRRKKCPACGVSHRTVEVPWDLAHEVLSDDEGN